MTEPRIAPPDDVPVPPPAPTVRVSGREEGFPVGRVFCVGRNYAAHAREMGHDGREPPFFFTKTARAVVPGGGGAAVPFPSGTDDLHHEVELCVLLGAGGRDVAPADVGGLIWGAAVGVDLTKRDVEAAAKAKGRPWDEAKGFDASAPMADCVSVGDVPSLTEGRIWLSVNGEVRQDGDLSEMIWPVRDHVAALSRLFALQAGDVVMTGTPAGVGPLRPGDRVEAGVAGLPPLDFTIR